MGKNGTFPLWWLEQRPGHVAKLFLLIENPPPFIALRVCSTSPPFRFPQTAFLEAATMAIPADKSLTDCFSLTAIDRPRIHAQ